MNYLVLSGFNLIEIASLEIKLIVEAVCDKPFAKREFFAKSRISHFFRIQPLRSPLPYTESQKLKRR